MKWRRRLARGGMILVLLLAAAAIYYSTLQPAAIRDAITILYVLITGCALSLPPFRWGMIVAGLTSACVLVWYFNDPPRNDRDWAPEYAIPAAVSMNGPAIHISNIRDFAWRTPTEAAAHYYDADFQLDQLSSVDLVASYWGGDTIAHIFLSFGFQDGRHVAISIETRRQKRFAYSALAGFFRHYELFYVVADERDLIGVRTDVRRERVYLYRLNLTPQSRQSLFLNYMRKVQALSEQPEWYNTLSDNCTTGILARAQAPGRTRLNWRVVLSGYLPAYAYAQGLLDNSVSFATLQQRSLIIRPAGSTITGNFSQDIR